MFDYNSDKFGSRCIDLTYSGKANVVFGAIFVKSGRVYGSGWNRRSRKSDTLWGVPHIDYCVHAEQAALIDAMKKGIKPTDGEIYVIGRIKSSNEITVRRGQPCFICKRCVKMLDKWQISVNIPHRSGWYKLSPQQAITTAELYHKDGFWERFAKDSRIY